MLSWSARFNLALRFSRIRGREVMANTSRAADLHSDETSSLRWRALFLGAVEPPEIHARIRRSNFQPDLPPCLEPIVNRQRSDAVGVVGVSAAAPHQAA